MWYYQILTWNSRIVFKLAKFVLLLENTYVFSFPLFYIKSWEIATCSHYQLRYMCFFLKCCIGKILQNFQLHLYLQSRFLYSKNVSFLYLFLKRTYKIIKTLLLQKTFSVIFNNYNVWQEKIAFKTWCNFWRSFSWIQCKNCIL